MAIFTGWYALGTGVSNAGVFQECTTYTRPAVSLSGNAVAGLTQAVSQITGPTGPVGGIINKGAIFDALTGGNCLCYWDWASSSVVTVPTNFAAVTVNVILNEYLKAALNLSTQGGHSASGSIVETGSQLGTLNGQPLVAAVPLSITGGALLAAVGGLSSRNTMQGSEYFQFNGVNVFVLDTTGNPTYGVATNATTTLTLLGTASALTSTGKLTINVAGTPAASLTSAGILTLKGTVTSSGTP